ncbi:hypothetical protein [Azorhizobium doebereinerae]|uniref:hypothetical protein n=1 Tax=Azorhizobium doebereinerae TaxID=281091 RepID=UPI0003F85BAF|nr:hypothetical protein [Azorhizobium doebereinerae]
MSQAFAYEAEMDGDRARPSPLARRGLTLAWTLFALLVLSLLFPFRYTSHAELSFDVAAQPTPSVVRGAIQLLSSREMAFDVVRALGPADAAALAAQAGSRLSSLWRRPDTDESAVQARAARTLAQALRVSAQQGGRALDIAVSLPDASRAARVADAYAGALLTLDASVRTTAEEAREPSPPLRLAGAATAVRLPDAPSAGVLVLLGLAIGLLATLTVHLRQRPGRPTGVVADGVLPREIPSDRRVSWLRSAGGASLGPEAAVDRLIDTVGSAARCDLVVLTSSDLPEEAAACSLALARRLAESEDQVVLVALDGDAAAFTHLLADPRAPGVAELLFGVAGFSEAIHRDGASRAHLIPPGRDSRGGPSVVGAERLTLILQSLRQTYSRVIVSAPSLAGTPGAERLAALAPLLIALHEDDASTPAAVETYDALAAKGFTNVAMLPLAFEDAASAAHETPDDTPPALPVPTLMAVAQPISFAA